VVPEQTGLSLLAVGADGIALTVAVVVAAEDVHPLAVAVTVYVPLAPVVAPEIDGFCAVEVKLFGPVQL
jgi:hypothetical protein